jgi:septation ring formation regulator EzrA
MLESIMSMTLNETQTPLKAQLAASLARRQQQRLAEWSATVTAAADGTLDPDEAAATLDRTNRSADELAQAVEDLLERRELQARLGEGPAARRRLAEVNAALTAADAELAEATKKHSAAVTVLQAEQKQLESAVHAESDIRNRLLQIAGEDVRADLAAARERVEATRRRLAGLVDQLHRLKSEAKAREGVEHMTGRLAHVREEIEQAEAQRVEAENAFRAAEEHERQVIERAVRA